MKRLLVGGPLDGEVEDVPGVASVYVVPTLERAGGTVSQDYATYRSVSFGFDMCRTVVFVYGNQSAEQIFCALLKAAGVDQ